MYFKLVVFGACIAVAASASIPSAPSQVDVRDAYYIPISKAEAEQLLRLPRYISPFKIPSLFPSLPRFRSADEYATGSLPNRRVRRSADAFETEDAYYLSFADDQTESLRAKRQLKIQGGGSLSKGIDIKAEGIATLWQSNNQRNSLQGTVQYKQLLGGPFGSSQPNFGGGLIFTHRF